MPSTERKISLVQSRRRTYPAPGLSGNDFLCRAGEEGWDLGWIALADPELPNLLTGKLLADLDFILPRTNEAGTGAVLLPLSELDRDVLTGPPWLSLWLPCVAGGGGIRVSLFCPLRDFSNSSSFCISSGDIWRVPFGSVGQGSAGTRGRLGTKAVASFSSSAGSSRGSRLVLILSGYKNSSWVPVLRRAWWKTCEIVFKRRCTFPGLNHF